VKLPAELGARFFTLGCLLWLKDLSWCSLVLDGLLLLWQCRFGVCFMLEGTTPTGSFSLKFLGLLVDFWQIKSGSDLNPRLPELIRHWQVELELY
jgi:hypothetical protein